MADPPRRVVTPTERDRHFTELGRFVSLYGLAEAMLKHFLARTVGVDPPTSKAIFSGVRTDQACSFIRRSYEARGEALPHDIDRLLQQMTALTNLRNDILHHGINFNQDPPVSSNRKSVLNVKAVRETVVTDKTLVHAGWDCARVMLGFAAFMRPKDVPVDEEDLNFAVREPWHYIPQKPPRTGRIHRAKSSRPKRKPRQLPPPE